MYVYKAPTKARKLFKKKLKQESGQALEFPKSNSLYNLRHMPVKTPQPAAQRIFLKNKIV